MDKKGSTDKEHSLTWRFRLGVTCFALSIISPVFIPLVYATGLPVEFKTVLSGLLIAGIPQLLDLLAVVILGKPGFNFIKGKVVGFFFKRLAPPSEVSRLRYYIGLVMFSIPIIFGWLAPYSPQLIPGYEANRFAVNFAGDLLLLISLFVLGGEFWNKVRSLYIFEAKTIFPDGASQIEGVKQQE